MGKEGLQRWRCCHGWKWNGKELGDDQGYPEAVLGWKQMSRQGTETWLLGSCKPTERDPVALCRAACRG